MFLQITFVMSVLLTIISAGLVASSKNIMHACIYLLGTLIGVAGLYLTLGADLLAATQLMVYVGGIVILMVFAVMLTGGQDFIRSKKLSFLQEPFMGSLKTYFYGIICAILTGVIGFRIIQNMVMKFGRYQVPSEGFTSTVEEIGRSLVTEHVLAFEVASVLLLGALVGAAIISRPKKSEE